MGGEGRGTFNRYGMAVLFAATVVSARLALNPLLHEHSPVILQVLGVLFAAWYGGIGPGLLATGLCTVASAFLFVSPSIDVFLVTPRDQVRLGIFAAVGTVASLLVGSRTAVIDRLHHALREQRQTESTARESAERLAVALEAGQMGTWDTDLATKRLNWSRGLFAILGYREDEVTPSAEAWRDRLHPEDRDRVEAVVSKAITAAGEYVSEYRIVRPDGAERWVESRARAVKDEKGRPVRLVGVTMDVTERRRTTEALLGLASELQALFDVASVGIVQVDLPSGRYVRVNPEYLRITGYSREEVLEMTVLEMTHPEDRAQDAMLVERMIRGESPTYHNEKRYVRKDGQVVWVEVSATILRDAQGQPYRSIAVIQDITERRRAEEALRKSEAWFASAFENAPIGITLVAPDGRWLKVNRAMCDIVGYPEAELMRLTFQDVTYPEDLPVDMELLRRQLAGEVVTGELEKRYIHKSGRVVWVLMSASMVRDAQRNPLYAIAQIQDITNRKRVEDALRELTATLEQRVRERTAELEAFSYTVSHDLRAPLRAMQGFSEALLEDYGDRLNAEGRMYATRIVAGASRMDRLIRDLLDYSRISRNEVQLDPVDLSLALADATQALQADIERTGAEVAAPAGLPVVLGHRSTLVLVLQNLIANALKFVRPGVRPRVEVTWRETDDRVRLMVSDNGIGIPKEHFDRIFRVFERLHGDEKYPGTGIGLALVRRAMDRMRGRCGVESEVDRGSTFWLEFQRATPS